MLVERGSDVNQIMRTAPHLSILDMALFYASPDWFVEKLISCGAVTNSKSENRNTFFDQAWREVAHT
jgi:hypothetical protein